MSAESFLFSALLLLLVVTFMVTFSKKLGLGSILGLLVAGIIVGPHSYGPALTQNVDTVRHFTEFGVVLLLFLIGLEIQPKKLWEMKKDVFGLGLAQIIISTIVIFAYFYFYALNWKNAILIALTYSLSSTAFVMQILQDRAEVNTKYGQTSFAILLMQDLWVVPLLAIVPILAESGVLSQNHTVMMQVTIAFGMIVSVLILGKYIIPYIFEKLAKDKNQEAFIFLVMLSVFFSAWAMEHAGLSMALGAFLMGMMLSESRYHLQIQAHIEPYKALLMSLFFVAVGMSIDLKAIAQDPVIIIQHVVITMALKIVVIILLFKAFKYSQAMGIKVAFLLSQSGEFGFVVFGMAKTLGVISDEMFVAGVTVISVSMLLTPLAAKIGDKLSKKYESSSEEDIFKNSTQTTLNPEVIIAGYGRVGRIVASILEQTNVKFVAYDTDIERVKLGQTESRDVHYGDMGDYVLLNNIDMSGVRLVAITLDNHINILRILTHIKNKYPNVKVFARSKDTKVKEFLLRKGANWVLPELLEGSLRFGEEILFSLNKEREDVDILLTSLRSNDYRGLKVLHEKTDNNV